MDKKLIKLLIHTTRCIFGETTSKLSVKRSCEFLGISRSALYYTSKELSAEEKECEEKIKACWVDNVLIERWFRSLKCECIYINEFESPRALHHKITEYIHKYNHERPHGEHGGDFRGLLGLCSVAETGGMMERYRKFF